MSTARSAFTEAIEEHLALKKQNASIETAMPLARYDVGDPLDRYPGGPNRVAEGTVVVTDDVQAPEFQDTPVTAGDATQMLVGPSPEQAMEAATALEPAFGDRPFEPLNGLAPMLSLVEDIEDEQDAVAGAPVASDEPSNADVLRFPGGVGPREDAAAPADEPVVASQQAFETTSFSAPEPMAAAPGAAVVDASTEHDAPTGEQPVLVIDADDAPLATSGFAEPTEPSRASRKKPRFFGLGRKKQRETDAAEGWFTDGPRDFNWD